MKLLIVTQTADRADPILGFFFRWIRQFAKHCDRVVVIAQSVNHEDTASLPTNVECHSLRKERGRSKLTQILRFWRLAWSLRGRYDAVLVHMTPIWIDLGGPLWLLLGKPLYLWYEIRRGGFVLRLALLCVRKVFSATNFGLPVASRKQVVTGHGIPTDVFRPHDESDPSAGRDPHLLVTVGRATPIKRFDLLLWSFAALPEEYRMIIAGGAFIPRDEAETARLRRIIADHGLEGRVEMRFHAESELTVLLQRARLFLHASGGGFDKAVLEAMACGCPVLSAGAASAALLPPECLATAENFPKRLQETLAMPQEMQRALGAQLRETVVRGHDLTALVGRLLSEMETR